MASATLSGTLCSIVETANANSRRVWIILETDDPITQARPMQTDHVTILLRSGANGHDRVAELIHAPAPKARYPEPTRDSPKADKPKPVRVSKPPKTKEGIPVKQGQMWESLHPRDEGRCITLTRVTSSMAYYRRSERGKEFSVRINLLHKHSRGWRLVATSTSDTESTEIASRLR